MAFGRWEKRLKKRMERFTTIAPAFVERDVYGSLLSIGKSSSCGCMAKHTEEGLVGQNFGILHVEEKVMINNRTYWRCSCQCGEAKLY